jgi:hypothetical protein
LKCPRPTAASISTSTACKSRPPGRRLQVVNFEEAEGFTYKGAEGDKEDSSDDHNSDDADEDGESTYKF